MLRWRLWNGRNEKEYCQISHKFSLSFYCIHVHVFVFKSWVLNLILIFSLWTKCSLVNNLSDSWLFVSFTAQSIDRSNDWLDDNQPSIVWTFGWLFGWWMDELICSTVVGSSCTCLPTNGTEYDCTCDETDDCARSHVIGGKSILCRTYRSGVI